MRSWIVHELLEALAEVTCSILDPSMDWLLSRRRFWILACACAGLLAAIAAVRSAGGNDAMTASVLGVLAAACAFASIVLALGRKDEGR